MSPLFDKLFRKHETGKKEEYELWRGDEKLAIFDHIANDLHYQNNVFHWDQLRKNVGIRDKKFYKFSEDHLPCDVGYIDSNGEIWSIAKNLSIGVIKPPPNLESDFFLASSLAQSIFYVFPEEDFPIPKEEHDRRLKEKSNRRSS